MESIFLALSGVILVAGVLYWFWSHIQLTQKKVQLLENAVFELRGMLQRGPGAEPDIGDRRPPEQGSEVAPGPLPMSPEESEASPAPLYNDLSDDDWKEESTPTPVNPSSTPLESLEEVAVDLQPGGRIEGIQGIEGIPGSESDIHETVQVQEHNHVNENEQFRELFMSPPAPPSAAPSLSDISSLDGMPVKDLRRLAEQRGIPNASELRKKEILSALKALIAPPSSAAATATAAAGPSVQVEKTLDLTEVSEILE